MYSLTKLCKQLLWLILLVIFISLLLSTEFPDPNSLSEHKYSNTYPISSSSIENGTVINHIIQPFLILFWTKNWHSKEPAKFFESLQGCGNQFEITSDRSLYDRADAVVFAYNEVNVGMRNGTLRMPSHRNPDAPWILATQESPIRTKPFQTNVYDGAFNLTWGYRSNADIRTNFEEMYEKYEKPDQKWIYGSEFSYEFLRKKTKLAAWVVSNCRNESSKRDVFVKELAQRGLIVDIYGKCTRPCHVTWKHGSWRDSDCFAELGKQYKFYMALENSLCLDYITEKSDHGWSHNMVPIIYALGKKELVTPPGSYIDAFDFETIEDLVEYVKFLDENPKEYFKYFGWRSIYNISSSFHSRAHCYAWEKMRDLTEELRVADESVRNRHVNRNLELWRSYFYNNQTQMYCRNCLTKPQVNITHLKQNRLTIYSEDNCLKDGSFQNLPVDWDSWY